MVQRVWFGGELTQVSPLRVVTGDERGLFLWLPVGAPVWRSDTPGGASLRDIPRERWPAGGFPLRPVVWSGNDILIHLPAGRDHAVWWMFGPDRGFAGWYVNLERRSFTADGFDVVDLELDIVVGPDRAWAWKDEESFVDKTGHPAFWSPDEADSVRAEGEQVAKDIESGRFPFDGSWCDFRPSPSWELPDRPAIH